MLQMRVDRVGAVAEDVADVVSGLALGHPIERLGFARGQFAQRGVGLFAVNRDFEDTMDPADVNAVLHEAQAATDGSIASRPTPRISARAGGY